MPDRPVEMMEMMEMLRRHIMVTEEIKHTVDRIDHRLRRIEEKIMG